MLKSIRGIVWCLAVSAMLGLIVPAIAMAVGHSSRRVSVGHVPSRGFRSTRTFSRREVRPRRFGGPLSYNAYWKAASSPAPPRTNQDYNRYWQKMQAWQQYHQQ
jgi:hypothetical protein